jgi:hypothetical protein
MVVNNYMLVYRGKILDGYNVEEVKRNVAGLLDKELWKVEFLFSGRKCVIKHNMGLRAAMQFQGILALTGALAEVVYRPGTSHQEPHKEPTYTSQDTMH